MKSDRLDDRRILISAAQLAQSFYQPDSFRSEESVHTLLKHVCASMRYQIDQSLAVHGLTDAQWPLLFAIASCQLNTCSALAKVCRMDTGAMSRAIDRLEANGLVARVRAPEDRRIVHLRLTDTGQTVAYLASGVIMEVQNLYFSGFTESEKQSLFQLLTRMRKNGDAVHLGASSF